MATLADSLQIRSVIKQVSITLVPFDVVNDSRGGLHSAGADFNRATETPPTGRGQHLKPQGTPPR